MPSAKLTLERIDQSFPCCEQKGMSKVAVALMIDDPTSPAYIPVAVTPPFVPGDTMRQGAVIRRGLVVDRIPSSEEKVSAATAA
jgi:hypothetical protein